MLSSAPLVKEKLEPIIHYRQHPISNGKVESINSQRMAIQRSARGFSSHASFRIAALFHCGGLQLFPQAYVRQTSPGSTEKAGEPTRRTFAKQPWVSVQVSPE
jgi:hypothetical protein